MSAQKRPPKSPSFRSLFRLVVGGVVVGAETLADRLQRWDDSAQGELSETGQTPQPADATILSTETHESQPPEHALQPMDALPDQLPPPHIVDTSPSPGTDDLPRVGYALVGLLLDGEETLGRWWSLSARAMKLAVRIADPLVKPFSTLPTPVQKRVDRLAARGQSKVDEWGRRGREETDRGRQITHTAVASTMDDAIVHMAQNPALEELVQQQSVSLAQQLIEQVRQIAVSADYFFEGVIRYLLHHPPRELLPPPSEAVQQQAIWRRSDVQGRFGG